MQVLYAVFLHQVFFAFLRPDFLTAGEKPYVCTVQGCGKRFTEYSSLYKHHVVHTHSKPYVCSNCGKTYRQTSTLAMHRRTAHGEDVTTDANGALILGSEVALGSGERQTGGFCNVARLLLPYKGSKDGRGCQK